MRIAVHCQPMALDKDKELTKLASRIRQLREDKNVPSSVMADRLNMEKSNYSRIEAGKQNLTYFTLLRICEILEINPADFMAGID